MAFQSKPRLLTRPTGTTNVPVSLDRSRLLAWLDVQKTPQNQIIGPSTDPTHSHWLHKFDQGQSYQIFFGKVLDSIAYTNLYKVQPERGATSLWCTALSQTSLQPFGAKQFGQIQVGSNVIFLLHKQDTRGVIVGVLPGFEASGKDLLVDFISQSSRSGLLVDSVHNYPFNLEHHNIVDYSAGRPFDSTTVGEVGYITETGLMFFLDPFMGSFRADEETGLWLFYHDQLTRLAGHNFQLWTSGHEREDLDDEGEFNSVQGYTPYYWEALGSFDLDTVIHRDYDIECWQKDPEKQVYSATEPAVNDQYPFFRLRDFYGYLGQAHKRIVQLPPYACGLSTGVQYTDDAECGPQDEVDESAVNQLSGNDINPGVFEESLSLSGRYAVRTAHEYVISKNVSIPSPKQIKRPEDPNGDKSSNYKAASALGSGVNHLVQGEIEGNDELLKSQLKASGFLDTYSYIFNWIGNHPFEYHNLDWYLPQESDLLYIDDDCEGPQAHLPSFDDLSCQQFIPTPPAIPIRVDHRYENVNYYPNHSYFALLDDGGIVLGDGFGSELKLTNGSIWLTAPGDIFLQSGRSVVNLAGLDFVARAKNSFDISSTLHDGRLKAKRNLMLGATGELGGILLQSNATSVATNSLKGEDAVLAGISIKAPNSLVEINGNYVNLNTENDFNLNVSNGNLRLRGNNIETFCINGGSNYFFFEDADEVVNGAELNSSALILCSDMYASGNVAIGGCLTVNDNITSVNGYVSTNNKAYGGKLGYVANVSASETMFTNFSNRCTELQEIGNDELDTFLSDFTLEDVNFSFRSVDNYRTNDFIIFENRWQQLARVGSVTTNTWTEESENGTHPYPGTGILTGNNYYTLDLNLYNIDEGRSVDRGVVYETPEFDTPNNINLNSNYTVIM